jgi:hypothetical protein
MSTALNGKPYPLSSNNFATSHCTRSSNEKVAFAVDELTPLWKSLFHFEIKRIECYSEKLDLRIQFVMLSSVLDA